MCLSSPIWFHYFKLYVNVWWFICNLLTLCHFGHGTNCPLHIIVIIIYIFVDYVNFFITFTYFSPAPKVGTYISFNFSCFTKKATKNLFCECFNHRFGRVRNINVNFRKYSVFPLTLFRTTGKKFPSESWFNRDVNKYVTSAFSNNILSNNNKIPFIYWTYSTYSTVTIFVFRIFFDIFLFIAKISSSVF